MKEEKESRIRNAFLTGNYYEIEKLKCYNQVNQTLELMEKDIKNFDSSKNYMYFLSMFSYLSKASELNIQEQKKIYEKLLEIRANVKQRMLTSKKDENRNILKKTLGKIEILSLVLCSQFDSSYETRKRDLIYTLIFEIKNLKVLESMIPRLPHQVNVLDPLGEKLLKDVLEKYLEVLTSYVKEKKEHNLDELIYFDRLFTMLLMENQNYMTVSLAKTLDQILDKKESFYYENEKYLYFIRKWRTVFINFLKNPKEKLKLPIVTEQELMYEFHVEKDFSKGLEISAQFLFMKNTERKKGKDLRTIYTVDSDNVKDKDDGFSCEKKDNLYHLGIHITNPLSYLKENDPIFLNAIQRSSTIYFEKMPFSYIYPSVLAENLFSLNEGTVRDVFSFYFDVDLTLGQIIKKEIKLEPVYIKKNDTYENCSKILQYGTKDKSYENTLIYIQELIPFLKSFFTMDATYQQVNLVTHPKTFTKSEHMNETLMIFMNHQISLLAKEKEIPILYRNHEITRVYEKNLKELKQSLEREKNNQVYLNEIQVALGQYPKSKYEIENKGHHGLGLKSYTHMTSPDRRIADDFNMLSFQKFYFEERETQEKELWKEYLRDIAQDLNERNHALRMFQKEYTSLQKIKKKI